VELRFYKLGQIFIFLTVGTVFLSVLNSKLEYSIAAIISFTMLIIIIKTNQIKFEKLFTTLLILSSVLCFYNLFFALDKEDAILGFIRSLFILAIFISFYSLSYIYKDKFARYSLIPISIIATLTALINLIPFNKEIAKDIELIRLNTVVPYSNTLAVLLFIGVVSSIFLTANNVNYKILYKKVNLFEALRFIMIIVIMTAFWLTYSRTMWLLAILCILIIFMFVKNKKHIILPGTALILSVFCALLIQKNSITKISDRITSTNPSATEFLERLAYYKDSIAIFRDHLFTGTGTGGWENIQFPYQSAIYAVKYVHSSLVQTALDGGVFGLLIYIGSIATMFYYIKKAIKLVPHKSYIYPGVLFLINLIILVHSLIDFDFEFSFINAIFWMNNGIIAGFLPKDKTESEIKSKLKVIFKSKTKSKIVAKLKSKTILSILIIFLIISLLPIAISSYIYSLAKTSYEKSDFKTSSEQLKIAEDLMPFSADYAKLRGDSFKMLYIRTKSENDFRAAENEYLKAQSIRRNFPGDFAALAYLYIEANEYKLAEASFNKMIELQPLVKYYYEIYARTLTFCIKIGKMENNQIALEKYKEKLRNIPKRMQLASKKISDIAYKLKHKPELSDMSKVIRVIEQE
jgi:hypothetical protein